MPLDIGTILVILAQLWQLLLVILPLFGIVLPF